MLFSWLCCYLPPGEFTSKRTAPVPVRKAKLFQHEPEEGCQSKQPPKRGGLFQPEPDEDEDSLPFSTATQSLNVDHGDYTSVPVFDFGWKKLAMAAKSRFMKEPEQEARAKAGLSRIAIKKRHYDNTKRAANAEYKRRGGKYKANGTSQQRILSVLGMDVCRCASAFSLSHFLFEVEQCENPNVKN